MVKKSEFLPSSVGDANEEEIRLPSGEIRRLPLIETTDRETGRGVAAGDGAASNVMEATEAATTKTQSIEASGDGAGPVTDGSKGKAWLNKLFSEKNLDETEIGPGNAAAATRYLMDKDL